MNKKVSLGAAVTFIAITAAVTITLTMFFSQRLFNEKVTNLAEREAMYSKLSEVDKYIRANFLGAIDEATLNDYIARGYVVGLNDKYATYYTASEYAAEVTALSGATVGIGISATKSDDGYMRVVEVYPNSPAETVGLAKDDLIVRVDNIDITQDTYQDAIKQLQGGEVGSTVVIAVRRYSEDIEMTLTRREISIPSVSSELIDESVGFIRITDFADATVSQFDQALQELQAAGATSLILDLRQNGGGSLEAMAKIADMILPEGEIVSAIYNTGVKKILHRSDADELNMPIVVLMDEATASSSEMLIEALIDYEKCKTVGTTTYGKNVMQQIHQLSDGSAVKITTARLYSPKGNNYDGVGVTPDYVVALENKEAVPLKLLAREQDAQLQKAIEVAQDWAKSYYGGNS